MAKAWLILLVSVSGFGASIVGVWKSDCQEVSNAEGCKSQAPVDTFSADGKATLRIHVFEGSACNGKEWDTLIIPCTYDVGTEIPLLSHTRELDLLCVLDGKTQNWYEIVELLPQSIRYGDQTGLVPEDRPKSLGNVNYQRLGSMY